MRVIEGTHRFELEEKKSRFIAVAVTVHSVEEALARLSELRDPTATHNCYAYRIGDQYRFFDDAEPTGTAGKPILAAITRKEIDHCLVVVIRFFGGIKLGAGGLSRAYGKCAAECLRNAATRDLIPRVRLTVTAPFEAIGDVYPALGAHGAVKLGEMFEAGGVVLSVELEETELEAFRSQVTDATRGRARIDALLCEEGRFHA